MALVYDIDHHLSDHAGAVVENIDAPVVALTDEVVGAIAAVHTWIPDPGA